MKPKLLIIGASGHGRVLADIAIRMKKWKSIAYLDDNESIKSTMGIEIIGKSNDVYKYINDYDIFVGIGSNTIRQKIQEKLESMHANIPVLIHPSSVIGLNVEIKSGTSIMAGAVINCCSNIGKGCIINTGATIDHDNIIEDYVHISPGAHLAGSVRVGKGNWLGAGCIIINDKSIIAGCKLGAGAVVNRNITEVGTYVGVPARRI